MQTIIPTQYSKRISLLDSPVYDSVLVCFVPQILAGLQPSHARSYVKFVLSRKDGARDDEISFPPVARWTEAHYAEWEKTIAMLGEIPVAKIFDDACLDLVL